MKDREGSRMTARFWPKEEHRVVREVSLREMIRCLVLDVLSWRCLLVSQVGNRLGGWVYESGVWERWLDKRYKCESYRHRDI